MFLKLHHIFLVYVILFCFCHCPINAKWITFQMEIKIKHNAFVEAGCITSEVILLSNFPFQETSSQLLKQTLHNILRCLKYLHPWSGERWQEELHPQTHFSSVWGGATQIMSQGGFKNISKATTFKQKLIWNTTAKLGHPCLQKRDAALVSCQRIWSTCTWIQSSWWRRKCSDCGFSCCVAPGCGSTPLLHHRWSSSTEQPPAARPVYRPYLRARFKVNCQRTKTIQQTGFKCKQLYNSYSLTKTPKLTCMEEWLQQISWFLSCSKAGACTSRPEHKYPYCRATTEHRHYIAKSICSSIQMIRIKCFSHFHVHRCIKLSN